MCECKMYGKSTWIFIDGIEWIVFNGHLDHFQKPSLGGGLNSKPGDHGTPNAHDRCVFYLSWLRNRMNGHSLEYHLVEGMVTYDFTLHLRVHDHTS